MDRKDSQAGDGDVPKKSPFDQLDRDELIKKCKGLLSIAKTAKQAKDEYAEENAKQVELIQKLETQKLADKESLKTMQEIVDNLTENKLETANRISDLEKGLSTVNTQLLHANDQLNVLKEHAIENESLKRQIKRLTDENEELISEMEVFETKSKEQHLIDQANYENLKLENEKLMEVTTKNSNLLTTFSDHQEQFDKISLELQETKEINEKLVAELSAVGEQNTIVTQHSRRQGEKLKLYKSKIIEFSAKLKQLKLSKEVLAKIVAEYSQSVTQWQLDIVAAMKQIESKSTARLEKANATESDSPSEVESVSIVETNRKEHEEKLSALLKTNEELATEMEQLKKQLANSNNLVSEKSQLMETFKDNSDEDKKIISELQSQLTGLMKEIKILFLKLKKFETPMKKIVKC